MRKLPGIVVSMLATAKRDNATRRTRGPPPTSSACTFWLGSGAAIAIDKSMLSRCFVTRCWLGIQATGNKARRRGRKKVYCEFTCGKASPQPCCTATLWSFVSLQVARYPSRTQLLRSWSVRVQMYISRCTSAHVTFTLRGGHGQMGSVRIAPHAFSPWSSTLLSCSTVLPFRVLTPTADVAESISFFVYDTKS